MSQKAELRHHAKWPPQLQTSTIIMHSVHRAKTSRVAPQVAENNTVIALGIALARYSQCQNATSHAKHIICRS